jgi:hypothetical protein
MIEFNIAQARCHRQNIERYCRLLATELTDLERQYLHKRIAEEHAQLEGLKKRQAGTTPAHLRSVIGTAAETTDQETDAERNNGGREGAPLDRHA